MRNNDSRDDNSPADALKQLAADLTMLAQNQLDAVRLEMTEKVRMFGLGAGLLSASAGALLFTLACLTALATVGLALVLPVWLSVLIVTLIWGAVSGLLSQDLASAKQRHRAS